MFIVLMDEDGKRIQLEIDLDDYPTFEPDVHVDAFEAAVESWLESNFGG